MDGFLQVVGAVLVTVVLGLSISRQGKDISIVLSIVVCCMVLSVTAMYLEPVMDFIRRLQQLGNLDSQLLTVMLKAVGIGLIAEVAGLICADSGNGAMAKTVQILASAAIVWLSLPLMESLIDLIQKMVGDV